MRKGSSYLVQLYLADPRDVAGDRGSDHLFAVCVLDLSPAGKRAIDRVECEGFQNLRHPPNLGGGEGD